MKLKMMSILALSALLSTPSFSASFDEEDGFCSNESNIYYNITRLRDHGYTLKQAKVISLKGVKESNLTDEQKVKSIYWIAAIADDAYQTNADLTKNQISRKAKMRCFNHYDNLPDA